MTNYFSIRIKAFTLKPSSSILKAMEHTKISAFTFENTLGKLKSLIRSGNKSLAQIC